jgi:transposase
MDPAERAAQAAEMRQQADAGWTHRQIADHHEVSVATVRRRLEVASVKHGRGGSVPLSDDESAGMWDLWVRGTTQAEIAKQFGVAQQTVSDRLNRWRERMPETDRQSAMQRCLDQLDLMQQPLLDLAAGALPPAYSNGRAMKDADGNLVPDHSLRIQAVKALLATQDRLARLLGLDAPAKTEVAVTEQAGEAAKEAAARAQVMLTGEASS